MNIIRRLLFIICSVLLFATHSQAQTALINGGRQDGAILVAGQTDSWTFTATNGDNIVLRLATLTVSNSFLAEMRIYAPNGTLLSAVNPAGQFVTEYDLTAATNGTFTVLVSTGGGSSGTGTYRFFYAKLPGPFIVPSGDEGGTLPQSGGIQDGTSDLGDLDLWTFTVTNGETIVLRLATLTVSNSFLAQMRIYAPNGTLLSTVSPDGNFVTEYDMTAATNGMFTVLVSTGNGTSGTGTYRFYYAKLPGSFIVPSGDEGGVMTNGGSYNGTILLGDLDMWSFIASSNNVISLQITRLLNTNTFKPSIRLYGTTGNILDSAVGSVGTSISQQATNSGTYIILVTDGNNGGTGTYNLTVNGISGPAKFGNLSLSGTNLLFSGSGGGSNGVYIVLNSTNIAASSAQWIPLLTNKFGTNSVFTFTNGINKSSPQKYFRLFVP